VSNAGTDVVTQGNVLVERRGEVALVTISRPEKFNALNRATLVELEAVFAGFEGERAPRAVVITGAGEKAFVSGADINELAVLDTRGAEEASAFGQRVFDRIERSRMPVIAAVNGFALGGGCELALACHWRYAAEGAKFGLPEVGLGIIPGYGGTQRLPRLVGFGQAAELIATGRMIDATEALRLGLVNRVMPPIDLVPYALEVAGSVAANAPLAVAAALEAARRGASAGFAEGLRLESSFFGVLGSTADMHDGLKAFLEKRKAQFQGR
jgi:enoyl-CoA hydratase